MPKGITGMEEKKRPVFKTISIIYFICLGLYLTGWLACLCTELEYRMWAWALGNCALFLGLPIWLFVCWLRWHLKKGKSQTVRNFVSIVSVLAFFLWGYLFVIFMVFTVEEEHSLFHGYLAVNRGGALSETRYFLCKSKALVFREDVYKWDTAFEIEYLEQKYHEVFLEMPFDEDEMLFYRKDGTGEPEQYYRETVAVPASNTRLPVRVVIAGGELEDDYIQLLTSYYITNGCMELGIDRPLSINPDGTAALSFFGEEDIKAAVQDLQKLIDYAMQDDIFRDYRSTIHLTLVSSLEQAGDAEWFDTFQIPFGKKGEWDSFGEEDYQDSAALEALLREKYEYAKEQREEMIAKRNAAEKEASEAEQSEEDNSGENGITKDTSGEENPGENETADDASGVDNPEDGSGEEAAEELGEYAKDARLIYEEILIPAGIGEGFSVDYGAKGQEYYPLGEDGSYAYTLVYGRDSENGECGLYVLYRSPYDEESGSYYSYMDTMTEIMDIYAVVKDTKEIIPSGRTAWSDTGNSAYREATGE